MKKLILTIALLLTATSLLTETAFASATLNTKVKVTPDVLIADTSSFAGKIGSFNGDKVSLNLKYMTAVGVFEGSPNTTVRFVIGGFSGNFCPNLSQNEQGKFGTVAFKTINDTHNSWVRNNNSTASAITFNSEGAVINSKYVSTVKKYDYIMGYTSACGTKGLYPAYGMTIDLIMPTAIYESEVEPNISGWAGVGLVTINTGGASTK